MDEKTDKTAVVADVVFDAEKVAKILSLVAIPILIAVFGWVIQNRLGERNLSQEYVKLAVSILEKPKSSDSPSGLRDWAVDLLNQNSPTKFSPETIAQLKSGEISLSGALKSIIETANNGGGVAVSPDGKTVATGQNDKVVRIWDLASAREVESFRGHTDAVTAVIYAPDGKTLYSGSLDQTVRRWDLADGRALSVFQLQSGVLGLAVSPDGRSLLIRTAAGELISVDIATGLRRSEMRLGGH
jgi:WD40 repeat protein